MTKARIIVDAMSGDNAPKAIIEGALSGAVEYGTDLLLVGNPEIIKPILDSEAEKYQSSPMNTLTRYNDKRIPERCDNGR